MHIFVVDYAYTVPLDRADELVEAHRDWLDAGYEAGVFLASGRKHPRTGGVMLAVGNTRSELDKILRTDPFVQGGVISFTITEFVANKTAPELERYRADK